MTLPADLAAFLAVLVRGLHLTMQALLLGGILFVQGVARPYQPLLGKAGPRLVSAGLFWSGMGGIGVGIAAGLAIYVSISQLMDGLGLGIGQALGAEFVLINLGLGIVGLMAAFLAFFAKGSARFNGLTAAGILVLAGSVLTSHAMARVEERPFYLLADLLHQAGASLWLGGIPFLLFSLTRTPEPAARRLVALRFSHLFMGAVALLVLGAAMLAWGYIGSLGAAIGTSFGIMVLAKLALLGVLMLMAWMNMRSAKGNEADGNFARLSSFAEVEIGIGLAILFVAASLASQPPAIDQASDQASWREIVERMEPGIPRFTSPSTESLTPVGTVGTAASERDDAAWSEFNHNWAGVFVLTMGLLALAERTGRAPWGRHWPLVLLLLAAGLFIRSDPESWPLGPIGFFERLRDPEVLQHRLVVLLIVVFGLFEWGVRTGRLRGRIKPLLFPVMCGVGGALLLVHSHSLTDVKQRFLIEFTHVPLGVLAILSFGSRWLEIRGPAQIKRAVGWVWPVCFILIGLLLLFYRES